MKALDLQRDPFTHEPDCLFYHSFDSIEQRLKILDGLVQGSDFFVLIIGGIGSGKTTMLNRYLASVESEWTSARIRLDPENIPKTSSEPEARDGYPVYVLHGSADPIVIVDDAHQLTEKELLFLIQEALVPGSQHKTKRLVLFGESKLYTAVTNLAATLSAWPAASKIYLPGFTEKLTADFLRHRLEIAGYTGELPFDADAIKNIHQKGGGYHGPANEFSHQWLVDTYSNKQEGREMLNKVSPVSRRMLAWVCAVIFMFLLAAFWFFSDRKPSAANAVDQKPAKTVFRKKIVQRPKMADRPVSPKAKVNTLPQALKKTKTMASEPARTFLPQNEPLPERALPPAATPKPDPIISKTQPREIRREKWLLSQDGRSYTIQIVGVSSEISLMNFIKRNQLLKQNEIAYYKSTFKGKPWYQVLYGIYPSKQDARLAADKLPENIRRAGPWIRKISGVQTAIGK
jgi:DamX protein